MSDASRPREDDASQPRPPQPGLQPPIPVLPVSAHIEVPKAALSTVEELRELLTTPPTSRLDSTRIFFRVSREKLDEWDTVFGEKEDRAVLARDITVSHAVVDLDAIPAADVNALLTPGEELEVPSATVFRYTGTQWVKHTEKDVTMPIDLTSLLCLEPVHTFSHLHARIADAHKRGVTHLVTYSGAVWCPPCRRIMPYVAPIVAGVNKSNADKGVRIEVVKLDRDAAESIDQVYGVEYIPFFQVFQTSGIEQHLEAINHPLPPVMPEDRAEEEWNEKDIASARALALKPLGSLQNSSNDGVTAFLERYCVPLNFNETF